MSKPPKVRVYELSKELEISNKELLTHLEKKHGVALKSHSSSIDGDVAEKIRTELSKKPVKAPAAKAVVKVPEKEKPAAKQVVKAPAKPVDVKSSESSAKKAPAKPEVSKAEKPVAKKPEGQKPAAVKPVVPSKPAPQKPSEPIKPAAKAPPPPAAKSPQKPATSAKPSLQPAPAKSPAAQTPAAKPKKELESAEDEEKEPVVVEIENPLTVKELGQVLDMRETEIIKHLFVKGVMVTINQTLDPDYAAEVATELGFEVKATKKVEDTQEEYSSTAVVEKKLKDGQGGNKRPPVISIMGHVDHGKTSLLDALRETRQKIVDSEAGGITQSIGAYTVEKDGKTIVFLDTPGHEAFTAMRMRGANATDIAILVVAADDGVMPQTIEAINHAKAAQIPIIIAVNKIDKEDADPDKVLVQLSDHGLVSEKWGGDTVTVEVSALQRTGIDNVLEMILLVSELLELKAEPNRPGEGVVVEAQLDKRKGPVATVLVQNGKLSVGDSVLIGSVGGRVRALINDFGERVQSAGPSMPVEILGLDDVPKAGDPFSVIEDEKDYKQQLSQKQIEDREQRLGGRVISQGFHDKQEQQEYQNFNFIVKADTQGSTEAVIASIMQLSSDEAKIKIIHSGTGGITEADVMLASASQAAIIGFGSREDVNAQKAANNEGVRIITNNIIYHIIEKVETLILGKLAPEIRETEAGTAEVRQIFTVGKSTVIAGCMVQTGKLIRNAKAVVSRGGRDEFTGKLDNLKRFKEDAKEVAAGYECGVSFDNYSDLKEGDIITVYTVEEVERTSMSPPGGRDKAKNQANQGNQNNDQPTGIHPGG
ncbi:MAG: translation initiation factor IF-2 [Vampirovibrio sp.]|nr:translation initiation factor IF-2 [Vampirovibrio sp.]